jgi:hypothetical protein
MAIFPLHARQNSSYIALRGLIRLLVESLKEIRQMKQILDAEERAPAGNGDERGDRLDIGPTRRKTAQSLALVVEKDLRLAPRLATRLQPVAMTPQRMERVRYGEACTFT